MDAFTAVASIVSQEPADNYTIWEKDVAKNLLVQLLNDNKKWIKRLKTSATHSFHSVSTNGVAILDR